MSSGRTVRRRVLRVGEGAVQWRGDDVVAEEPLEIRIAGAPVAVTMRTPGNDFELCVGFLFSEGLITAPEQVERIQTCSWKDTGEMNVLDVVLRAGAQPFDPAANGRNFYTTSSCGLCGKASIEAIRTRAQWEVVDDPLRVTPALLGALPVALGFGQGGEARMPLGLTVVGGLLFSQLITLYLTPVVYIYLAGLQQRFQRPGRVTGDKTMESPAASA